MAYTYRAIKGSRRRNDLARLFKSMCITAAVITVMVGYQYASRPGVGVTGLIGKAQALASSHVGDDDGSEKASAPSVSTGASGG